MNAGPAAAVQKATPPALWLGYPPARIGTTQRGVDLRLHPRPTGQWHGPEAAMRAGRTYAGVPSHRGGRWIRSQDVILTLSRLMKLYGKPEFICSDNGAEFTAGAVMRWLRDQNVAPAFIAPVWPWQNGRGGFHGKLRDECLKPRVVPRCTEARLIVERWRLFYNQQRPPSALGYRTPLQARQNCLKQDNIGEKLTA